MRSITLTTIIVAALAGCSGGGGSSSQPNKYNFVPLDNIEFTATPDRADINQRISLKIEEKNKKIIEFFYIDQDAEVDSNKDGNPENDTDLTGTNALSATLSTQYNQAGIFTLVIYANDSRGVLGQKKQTVLIKPNNFFTDFQEAIPDGFFYIKKSDYDRLVKPYIDLLDQTFISSLESIINSNLVNGDSIDGFGFKSDGLIVGVNSPNSRFKEDTNKGVKDYSGSLDARLVDLGAAKNIYDFLTQKAVDNDMLRIAAAISPNNSTIIRNSPMTLLNYGDILCNFILSYTLNGNQINLGVVLDTTTSPLSQLEKDIGTSFDRDYRDKGVYIPLEIVVIKDGSLYDTVRAVHAELAYHTTNNP